MVTTHNKFYLWFLSDHWTAGLGRGFEIVWNTIDPGIIQSLPFFIE
jgi:hypothetical protein